MNLKRTFHGKTKYLPLKNVEYGLNCRTNFVSLRKEFIKGSDLLFKGPGNKFVEKNAGLK